MKNNLLDVMMGKGKRDQKKCGILVELQHHTKQFLSCLQSNQIHCKLCEVGSTLCKLKICINP